VDGDGHSGVGTGEVGDQRGGVHRTDRRHAAEAQPAPDQPLQGVQVRADAVQFGERATGPPKDKLARLGHLHLPGGAAQQLDTQLALEPADLLRDRRLCDVKLQRRPGERAAPGNGVQVTELAELHAAAQAIAAASECCQSFALRDGPFSGTVGPCPLHPALPASTCFPRGPHERAGVARGQDGASGHA
jgi:hypothetical protein